MAKKKQDKLDTEALADSIYKLQKLNNYNRWIYDNIKSYIGHDILEIGCGIGNMIDYLISPERKITGIDIEERFVNVAKEKYKDKSDITIVSGDVLNPIHALPGKKFDTVVVLNVLEHIEKERDAIKYIYDMLQPNGRAVILVPAMKFAYGEIDSQVGHHKRYEKPDMTALFNDNGFIIEKIFYMNWIGALGWVFNSRVLKRKLLPEYQANIMNSILVPIIKPLESIIKPPFGQSLITIARKNP